MVKYKVYFKNHNKPANKSQIDVEKHFKIDKAKISETLKRKKQHKFEKVLKNGREKYNDALKRFVNK